MIPQNLFGIIRKGRAQGVEMGQIVSKIPENKWNKCKNDNCDHTIIENDNSFFIVNNDIDRPLLKGKYILTQEKIIPWNYNKFYNEKSIIQKYIKVEIQ